MAFTLSVRNYRGLRHVDWSPSGVCALVGPNGSGKTTLIDVLQLLQDAIAYGFMKACELHGGAYGLRHFAASPHEPVAFNLRVGSTTWSFQPELYLGLGGASVPVWEKLMDGDRSVFEQGPQGRALGPDRLLLSSHGSPWEPPSAQQISALISTYRHYRSYALANLRREGSLLGGDTGLLNDGRNLFTVLMNWRNRRDYRGHLDFVTHHLRACFPELFSEFSSPIAANIVSCEIHTPQGHTLTPALLPDGFLVALLHLCAVASIGSGGVAAIDEPENALHPYTTHRLMEAFRDWSDARDVTVLLATHSPVILDTFKDLPEKVFVMEPGHEELPVPLDRLKKRSWLAHFSLGDLYEHLKYGAPAGVEET